MEVRRPWERLPQESSAAYLRFRRFHDLDPAERTVRAAAGAEPGRHVSGYVERLAARFRWAERAAAWDAEIYRIEDEGRIEAIAATHRPSSDWTRGLTAP